MTARDARQTRDRRRIVIGGVRPEIDCGRFPAKRVAGESMVVEADIFADGHEALSARVLSRHERDRRWRSTPMEFLGNDLWRASFDAVRPGFYRYTVEAWLDTWQGWRRDMQKRLAAYQDVRVDIIIGGRLLADAADRASSRDAKQLHRVARQVLDEDVDITERIRLVMDEDIDALAARYPDLDHVTRWERDIEVFVEPERAQFSAWYELFPRSATDEPGRHGTFADVERRLDYVAELGFDVLYLPPIHPIGRVKRKGANNRETAEPGEPGSPWAIGAEEGGHRDVHPELGSLEDFRRLVAKARDRGIEVALDIAFQVAPDHPWVKEHPDWFRERPDGSIQYAENPPKKYQDIYPFDFETKDWKALWEELAGVFEYWIAQGVRTFRVDNPHTKPFGFWEWCITRIRNRHPDVVFLSEAFTTPRRMERLAKLGFTQSYTYFAWRNTKQELIEYLEELTQTEMADYFRPNFWPNTPDILTEYLQTGGRAAFMNRIVLAGTLSSNYGIYGPAYELMEHEPREPGSEEYLDSEKYQIRHRDLDDPRSLRHFIARLNRIRRENRALHDNRTLRFHSVHTDGTESEHLIAYTKSSAAAPVSPTGRAIYRYEDFAPPPPGPDNNVVLTVVNMHPSQPHSGWVRLPLQTLGIDAGRPYQVHDLLGDARYTWQGEWNFIELDPGVVPAHIFRITQDPD
ncbi:MAG TPA: alpha-1,4-glucan--maltose-1-phosphate maltosyltransferase [Longimicrobiales bacterium]|nr:alpha-1,4-glucan--maltose-1-phosphate maltosyltransferase [Longimicrobiales bacterium]